MTEQAACKRMREISADYNAYRTRLKSYYLIGNLIYVQLVPDGTNKHLSG